MTYCILTVYLFDYLAQISTTMTPTGTPSTPVFTDPSFTKTEVIYMALMACVFCLIVIVCLVIGKRGSRASEELSTLNSGNTSEALALTGDYSSVAERLPCVCHITSTCLSLTYLNVNCIINHVKLWVSSAV